MRTPSFSSWFSIASNRSHRSRAGVTRLRIVATMRPPGGLSLPHKRSSFCGDDLDDHPNSASRDLGKKRPVERSALTSARRQWCSCTNEQRLERYEERASSRIGPAGPCAKSRQGAAFFPEVVIAWNPSRQTTVPTRKTGRMEPPPAAQRTLSRRLDERAAGA